MAKTRPPARPVWTPADILLAGFGFGAAAGALEALAALIRRVALQRTLYVGPDYGWMLPLADGGIFVGAGLLLVAASLLWRPLRTPVVALSLFGGLAVFSLTLLWEEIHPAAGAVLALGLGVGMARRVSRDPARIRRVLRVGAPAILVLLAVTAVGTHVARSFAERRLLANLTAAAPGRPNLLLLVLDTVRAWNLSVYGYGRNTTPKLRALAAHGVTFQRAVAPAPWTTLSHATVFTGRYPTELSVGWRTRYDGAFPTLAEVLRDAGYATAGFAGNYLNIGRGTGLTGGFTHYEDFPFRLIPILRSTALLGRLLGIDQVAEMVGRRRMVQQVPADEINRDFLAWLDRHGNRPWFAFLNYFDAHGPYLPPAPYDTMYMGKADPPVDRYWARLESAFRPLPLPEAILSISLDAYDGAITYLDDQVDGVLRSLAARGQLENTVVVITSDHGELFGEHGILAHGNNLYLPVLHVPLLLIAPGRLPANAKVEEVASLRDLAATLLDLAGVANPGLPGHSLVRRWAAGPASPRPDTMFAALDFHRLMPKWPPTPVLRGSMRTVILDSLQYIFNRDGTEELFHLGRDSWEIHNLVSVPEYQSELSRYRGALRALPLGKGFGPFP